MIKERKLLGVIALILSFSLLSLFGLTSCGKKLTEEEILGIFAEKYQTSKILNEYIFGKGLPVSSDGEESDGEGSLYIEVSEEAEYRTKDAFISAINSVYSADYVAETVMPKLFDGFGDDSDISPRYSEKDGILTKNIKDSGYTLSGSFDPSTATVKKLTSTTARIKAEYITGAGNTEEFELLMLLENGEWKFNGPTY